MKTCARALAACLLGILLVPSSSYAAGQGCTVVGAEGHAGGSCTYIATGAGVYAVAAPSGWSIEISSDGGLHYNPVAGARPAGCMSPVATPPAFAGTIPSALNDLVRVSVTTACVTSNAQKYQAGVLVARDNG